MSSQSVNPFMSSPSVDPEDLANALEFVVTALPKFQSLPVAPASPGTRRCIYRIEETAKDLQPLLTDFIWERRPSHEQYLDMDPPADWPWPASLPGSSQHIRTSVSPERELEQLPISQAGDGSQTNTGGAEDGRQTEDNNQAMTEHAGRSDPAGAEEPQEQQGARIQLMCIYAHTWYGVCL